MAEMSYWWNTSESPTGDRVTGYSQDHLAVISKVLANLGTVTGNGIIWGYRQSFQAIVAGPNTVDIAGGGAIVDGRVYEGELSGLNIPSASGGGNTRIDRIILRASGSPTFTVRITRVAGTDAASPSVPSINAAWDVLLYQALVDTSGNITLTDEREYGIVAEKLLALEGPAVLGRQDATTGEVTGIEASADNRVLSRTAGSLGFTQVTTSMIQANAIDDTLAGNRVPQFYRRQGGNATDWNTPGTTTYTPAAVRMQAGVVSVGNLAAGAEGTASITFPVAFSAKPLVFVSPGGPAADECTAWVAFGYSTTGFTGYVKNLSGTEKEMYLFWQAIGPE